MCPTDLTVVSLGLRCLSLGIDESCMPLPRRHLRLGVYKLLNLVRMYQLVMKLDVHIGSILEAAHSYNYLRGDLAVCGSGLGRGWAGPAGDRRQRKRA